MDCAVPRRLSPCGCIVDHGKAICMPSGMSEMGEVTKKLYDTLTGIRWDELRLLRMDSCD